MTMPTLSRCTTPPTNRPEFPAKGFADLGVARARATQFVRWYNGDRRQWHPLSPVSGRRRAIPIDVVRWHLVASSFPTRDVQTARSACAKSAVTQPDLRVSHSRPQET